jgi:hypothetical protein
MVSPNKAINFNSRCNFDDMLGNVQSLELLFI